MMLIIGLMSGTSVDAIDAALVRITRAPDSRTRAKVLHHIEHPWPEKIRARLLAAMAPATTTTEEICQLNFLVAHHFAAAVEMLLAASRTPRKKITALAAHGQTICHLPPVVSKQKKPHAKFPSTLQLGDPSVLATLTRIPTVANFRPADMALGGHGAPLVPFADALLLSHPTKIRVIQNIGGIANLTYLPALNSPIPRLAVSPPPPIAFDTGPGNMLLDSVIARATHNKQRFDRNGQLAAKGSLDLPLFRKLQSHPYFTQRPPKSTGRETFGAPLAAQLFPSARGARHPALPILLHTLTRLTAWSIADAYLHFLPRLPDEVILCGGGADNPTLVTMLAEELAALTSDFTSPTPPKLFRIDDFGIPNKSKEAASFALLAAATLDRLPGNLPSVTGASRPTILGVIATPS